MFLNEYSGWFKHKFVFHAEISYLVCNLIIANYNITCLPMHFESSAMVTKCSIITGSSPQSSGEEKENRGRSNSMVARLSMGFEQLEANARDTEIQLGREGR